MVINGVMHRQSSSGAIPKYVDELMTQILNRWRKLMQTIQNGCIKQKKIFQFKWTEVFMKYYRFMIIVVGESDGLPCDATCFQDISFFQRHQESLKERTSAFSLGGKIRYYPQPSFELLHR